MHMADALISAAVGTTMYAASGTAAVNSINRIKDETEEKLPLMGVMGAFIFAAQMINFTIPGTGSSGHLGGGLLLAVMLGPYAGFLTLAAVLLIQALIFADGGLLAYGCNLFNLGFYTCFIAYPFVYKLIAGKNPAKTRIFTGSVIAAVSGLQLGSFSVVIQTLLSGKTELPFSAFVILMQPIHLAIGIVEGLVTASVIMFVWKTKPEILIENNSQKINYRGIIAVIAAAAVIVGGGLSLYASQYPDGLEWSVFRTYGEEELETESKMHAALENAQEKIAVLPDYGYKNESGSQLINGTSFSGIVGSFATMLLALSLGYSIRKIKSRKKAIE